MFVIHEYTGEKINIDDSAQVLVQAKEETKIYGFVKSNEYIGARVLYDFGKICLEKIYKPFYEKKVFYSSLIGTKIISFDNDEITNRFKYSRGTGDFPYSFARHYEAIESFDIYDGKQQIDYTKNIGELFHYTFGLEFETNGGYIPEEDCMKNGLIPLRDGSIPGLEYSTVILNKSEGVNLLKTALKDLNRYTGYDVTCSLHMHLGGFPLDSSKIWKLYKFLYKFQYLIQPYISEYAFHTAKFKPNEKDYCKPLPLLKSFPSLYKYMTGVEFFGDFYQPHPNDRYHEAKWRIPTRYFFCNLINLLCYDANKTVEFRFLHPTFNYNRIIWWMLTFNALLYNAEISKNLTSFQKIEDLFKIYPRNIQKQMKLGLEDLLELKRLQIKDGDDLDMDNTHEYRVFSNLNFDL